MKERMTSSLATERTRELLDSFDEVSEKEKEPEPPEKDRPTNIPRRNEGGSGKVPT